MKSFCRALLVLVAVFFSVSVFAAEMDGVYGYSWRSKGDARDMEGWWGVMSLTNGNMSKFFRSPDGKTEKYYVNTVVKDGDIYAMKFTHVYNPEYKGVEHKNKMTLVGKKLIIESTDGGKTFKEVWEKK